MRCDLHVHTRHSGMCTVPLLRAVCRESYNEPAAVYERLKRLGMDLVTVTDHDSIDAAEELRSLPDFFLSEEITCRLPSGTEAHVGVYDITERDHSEFERRRRDFPALLSYLNERRLFFTINHALSSLTGRRVADDFACFAEHFPGVETHNAHMLRAANRGAGELALWLGKAQTGGSDAHAMASVGTAWTEVPAARSRSEYLEGLRLGAGRVYGEAGSVWKLTRDVFAIAGHMVRESPATLALAPLGLLVPVVTLANYACESAFARIWSGRLVERGALRAAIKVAA